MAFTSRDYVVLALLSVGAFLTQFDVTAIAVALVVIGREWRIDTVALSWIATSYSIAFMGMLLLAGALADRFGRRRAFLWGNFIFAIGSIACVLSPDATSLIAARVVKGFGAAFVITGCVSLTADAFPDLERRGRAFAIVAIVSGVAMALGPTLGAWLTHLFGWRVIFLVNVPICIAVLAVSRSYLPEGRSDQPRPLDAIGAVLAAFSLLALVQAIISVRDGLLHAVIFSVIAVMLCLATALHQNRRSSPILDPKIFATPAVLGFVVSILAVSSGYWSLLMILPGFLQALRFSGGDSALLIATIPMLIVPILAANLVQRWGWPWFLRAALGMIAIGDILLLLSASFSSTAMAVLGMALIGTGGAVAHPQLSGAIVGVVPQDRSGVASALTIVARQSGFAVGIALVSVSLFSVDQPAAYGLPFGIVALISVLAAIVAPLEVKRSEAGTKAPAL